MGGFSGRRAPHQLIPTAAAGCVIAFHRSAVRNSALVPFASTIDASPDSGTQAELTKVVAISRDEACAVGRNGTVLLTTDGGKQWYRQNLRTEVDVYALTVRDKEYWVGVSDGTVFRFRAQ